MVAASRVLSVPPARATARRAEVTLVAWILLGFVVVGTLMYSAQFSGTARWVLGVLFVALLALAATYAVVRRTANPEPLAASVPRGEILEGPLAALTAVVDRADRGFAFSQSLLVGRVREALIERIRIRQGLAPGGIDAIASDRASIRALVGDPVLADFLHRTQEREGREAWAAEARRQGGFRSHLQELLVRMEAWR